MIIGLSGQFKPGDRVLINWNPLQGKYYDNDQPVVIVRKATKAEFISYNMAQDTRELFLQMIKEHPLDARGYWEVTTD